MNLICAVCGGNAPARHQWYNRDTGYGCCERCFLDEVKKVGIEQAIRLYGAPGIHHSMKPRPETKTVQRLREVCEFNEADCGGAFDGNQVTSDADPGL